MGSAQRLHTILIAGSFFKSTDSRAYAQLGNELIAYAQASAENRDIRLSGVARGIFGTTASPHADGTVIRKLTNRYSDDYYAAFFWGSNATTEMGTAVANSINDTGMDFISLDGIESFFHNQHGYLSMNVFYKTIFDNLDSKELHGEASRLTQYNWHFHNRFMWGESSLSALRGTFSYQFANQVMMNRNFLHSHTGGFYANSNTTKDFGWLGSKMAAMNAGTMIRSQQFDSPKREVMRKWIEATEAGAFSDLQRARMMPWDKAYALDEVDSGSRWRLWDQGVVITYGSDNLVDSYTYTQVQGAPTQKTNPFYVARPWAGFSTRNVAGDALVTTSSKRDPSFQGDNAVDGHIGYYNEGLFAEAGIETPTQVSEWHTAAGDSERWIELTWDRPQRIRAVLLSDRSDPSANVTAYRLEFSSGMPVTGSSLSHRGAYKEHYLPLPRDSTSLKVVITGFEGNNPGIGEIVVIADDADFKGHLAKNAMILDRPQNHDPSHAPTGHDQRLFDGVTDSAYPNFVDVGADSKFIVIDLGSAVMVDGLNVWRFYNDDRQYHDVVYQLSTTSDFSTDVTTVFNNDANNSNQQGTGSDQEYREGPLGRPVYFPPVRARYLRLWSRGNTVNNNNHYTEVEVYGMRNVAIGRPVSQTGDAGYDSGSSLATDGNMRNGAWNIGPKATWRHRQLDIGGPWAIDSLRVWHELSDSRRIRYKDVVMRLSTTADFSSDVTTVFNNDLDNSLGLGAGTDGEYDETESGKIVHFPQTRARYIRLHTFGNNYDDQNRLLEVMVGQRASLVRSEAPVAMAGALVTLVNTAGNLDLSTLASDPEDGTLSYATTNPTNGSVSLTGAVVTYTPNDGYFGSDSFTYSVTDVDNAPATATVSVTVHRAPTAQDASVTTPANTALTYDLSPLAFDPDGDTLTWMVGVASHGMARLQFVTGGSVIYTPNAGYLGMDSFTYTVADSHGATATGTITVAVGALGALMLKVNAIATDNTVNIEERAAGFAISGDTGSVGGVTVTVRVGTTDLTATSSNDDPAIWSVNVPGNAAYIAGSSVAVTVSAAKTGYTAPNAQTPALAVDLMGPVAPTYTAPSSLRVGVAIAEMNPTVGGADIDEYGAPGLPSGLSIDAGSGVIGGTPDTANASTASVRVTVKDTAGNAATVDIAFPMVAKGDQALSGFQYSASSVTFGDTAPAVTMPSGAQGALSYSATPSTVCTVGRSSGALTIVGAGDCEVTVTAAVTADYEVATAMFTVAVAKGAQPLTGFRYSAPR